MRARPPPARVEFGDFQTPLPLARAVCRVLLRRGVDPDLVIEPTCGEGSFLLAATEAFPKAHRFVGLEVNPVYVATARGSLARDRRVSLRVADFFSEDWRALFDAQSIAVIGNPPWVTNAAQGAIGGRNLPPKENIDRLDGMSALTGKSNFDISEWMVQRLGEAMLEHRGVVAMLIKTAVARKVLRRAWTTAARRDVPVAAALYHVDAQAHFGASVSACLLVLEYGRSRAPPECAVFESLEARAPAQKWGLRCGRLIANVDDFDRHSEFVRSVPSEDRWRSGVKHDCSPVMELRRSGPAYVNGRGQAVDIEGTHLYPLLKSSDLAKGREPSRYVLLTQRSLGEATAGIASSAPKTWAYLLANADALDKRASRVYRSRPRFSVFGVGPYTLAPWKVAVSGFYKQPVFRLVGPACDGKATLVDDTCYFLAYPSRAPAEAAVAALNSDACRRLLRSLSFADEKRPLTIDILRMLDLEALLRLGRRGARNRAPKPGKRRTAEGADMHRRG